MLRSTREFLERLAESAPPAPEKKTEMAYDVKITGGSASWGYSADCSRIWRKAGCDIAKFDGKKPRKLFASLSKAIQRMKADEGTFEAMHPKNHFGDFHTLLDSLEAFAQDICRDLEVARARKRGLPKPHRFRHRKRLRVQVSR